MFFRPKPHKMAYLFILYNNRLEKEEFLKITSTTVETKKKSYSLNDVDCLPDGEGVKYYFVNKVEPQTFNPSTVLEDFRHYEKQSSIMVKAMKEILSLLEQRDLETVKDKDTIKEIKKILITIDFKEDYETQNKKITPEAQKQIMENNLIEGLAKREKFPAMVVIAILGCGAAIGLVFGVYIGGDTFHQEDYNENYYTGKDDNSSIVVIDMMEIDNNFLRNVKNGLRNIYSVTPIIAIIFITYLIYDLHREYKERFVEMENKYFDYVKDIGNDLGDEDERN